jgi:hypothetical protein
MGTAWNFSMTFFASRGLSLQHLKYEDGAFVTSNPALVKMLELTSGGLNRVEIDRYDAFVFVDLGFGIDLLEICSLYRVIEQRCRPEDIRQLLSHACFQTVVASELESSLAVQLAGKLRSLTGRPILICPRPFPAASALDEGALGDRNALYSVFSLCKAAAAHVAKASGLELVWPPDETMEIPGFTKSQYAFGGLRLRGKQQGSTREDGMHMNEDYGDHVCRSLLGKLDDLSEGAVFARNPPQSSKVDFSEGRRHELSL